MTEGEDSFVKLMLTTNDTIARLKAKVMLIWRKRESNDHLKAVTSTKNELQPIIEQATREITCVANQSTLTSFSQQSGVNNNVPVSVNLPKLHPPTFDGSVLNGLSFGIYLMCECTNRIVLKAFSHLMRIEYSFL